jgi:hypothetical protein
MRMAVGNDQSGVTTVYTSHYRDRDNLEIRIFSALIVITLVIIMLFLFFNNNLIKGHISSDTVLVLVFVLPLIITAVLYILQTEPIADKIGSWIGHILFTFSSPIICLIMFMLILGLSIEKTTRTGILESVKGITQLFLIFPLIFNLVIVWFLLIKYDGNISGAVITMLPVVYVLFAIIGAVLGAIISILFS